MTISRWVKCVPPKWKRENIFDSRFTVSQCDVFISNLLYSRLCIMKRNRWEEKLYDACVCVHGGFACVLWQPSQTELVDRGAIWEPDKCQRLACCASGRIIIAIIKRQSETTNRTTEDRAERKRQYREKGNVQRRNKTESDGYLLIIGP